jgi:hypothetical protein
MEEMSSVTTLPPSQPYPAKPAKQHLETWRAIRSGGSRACCASFTAPSLRWHGPSVAMRSRGAVRAQPLCHHLRFALPRAASPHPASRRDVSRVATPIHPQASIALLIVVEAPLGQLKRNPMVATGSSRPLDAHRTHDRGCGVTLNVGGCASQRGCSARTTAWRWDAHASSTCCGVRCGLACSSRRQQEPPAP